MPDAKSYSTVGNFWVFGGVGVGAELNDLWMFRPATRQWTWISGTYGAFLSP
jgi:hypothetical protein